jgi:hypothetical protein
MEKGKEEDEEQRKIRGKRQRFVLYAQSAVIRKDPFLYVRTVI